MTGFWSHQWRPGLSSRLERRRASHTYGFVLLLVAVSFLFISTAPDATWAACVTVLLQAATMLSAVWTSGLRPNGRLVLLPSTLALVAVLGLLVGPPSSGRPGAAIADVLLLASACGALVLGIIDQGAVNRQSVLGAVCIYLALGLGFTFAYDIAATLGSGDFFAQGTDGSPSVRLYFSYVTLATLGYGDYTPAHYLGRTLAIIEALMGQIYLVTVVALLVSMLSSSRSST